MNLHQVKGLEAPIVYLGDGSGAMNEEVDLCIDRAGERVSGYLAVRAPRRQPWQPGKLLAVPVEWDEVEAREKLFKQAENDRLLYVAATRAGRELVICRPTWSRCQERWEKLIDSMKPPVLPEPAPLPPPAVAPAAAPAPPLGEFVTALAERREHVTAPTYEVRAVKSLVRGGVGPGAAEPAGDEAAPERLAGEHGTEWGEVIHAVLEAAASAPIEELTAVAEAALEEAGLDRAMAPRVLDVVRGVVESDVWRRSAGPEAGAGRLVEVPIQAVEPARDGAPATIVRGVIDLVFREPGSAGWVIVDYKTDDASRGRLEELRDHYAPQLRAYAAAWARHTGEPVIEAGLLFVHGGRYARVELAEPAVGPARGQMDLFVTETTMGPSPRRAGPDRRSRRRG
jgi:ATP-dependent helicase/nuclease subunit A